MVNHCANPICHKPLHYLREGKVFRFSHKNSSAKPGAPPRLEHYWLCGVCASEWTLASDGDSGVKMLKIRRNKFRASHAMPYIASAS